MQHACSWTTTGRPQLQTYGYLIAGDNVENLTIEPEHVYLQSPILGQLRNEMDEQSA